MQEPVVLLHGCQYILPTKKKIKMCKILQVATHIKTWVVWYSFVQKVGKYIYLETRFLEVAKT